MPVDPSPAGPDAVVAVVGPGDATADEESAADLVGHGLAAGGASVVCGGLGGVMAAACAGARRAGGLTIGILPGTDRHDANPDVVVAVPTGMGEARNVLVVGSADVVVAVGGGYGTLSEIALALRAGIPVVGLGTWALARDGQVDGGIVVAEDVDDAVRHALAAATSRR